MALRNTVSLVTLFFALHFSHQTFAQQPDSSFKVLGFYTAKNDLAHISFVQEANEWFTKTALQNNFDYQSTDDWTKLNADTLARYTTILFLDTRPEEQLQRSAFEQYMQNGGGWIGFHFAGFALTPSSYPQNWDWYHEKFLGSGQYKGNTWRPTAAILRNENPTHIVTKNLPATFTSAPNEWYSWQNDLSKNQDIDILLSIDTAAFPVGTGPKPHEIWHSGYYPVVWTNKKYRMLYINMGHNDMDYGGTNKALSSSFANDNQNTMLLNAVLWLSGRSTNNPQ